MIVVAAGAAEVSYWSRPRTLDVCVVTDYSFRQQHPNWQDSLQSRFDTANRIFSGTGLHWNFRHAGQPDPTWQLNGMEERRQKLVRAECQADIILGVTARPASQSAGDVPAFAHTAMVVDSPTESDTRNRLVFGQALAALFGAPIDPRGSGTLMTQPPESEVLRKPVRKLIARLRWYDFSRGTAALERGVDAHAFDALATVEAPREAHRVLGMSLAADQLYPPAIRHLTEAVKLDSSNAGAHVELAAAYTQNYQAAEAAAEYRAAVRLAPDNAAYHAGLAVALANAGAAEQAVDEFQAALHLDPRFATAQAGLAYVLSQQLGRVDDAIAAYRAALEMNPALPSAVEGIERARAIKESAAARVPELRKRVLAAPSEPAAHFDLGLAEGRAGDVEAGIKSFRRSLELDPANGRAHANLAMLLYARKEYPAALREAQAAAHNGFDAPAALLEALQRKAL